MDRYSKLFMMAVVLFSLVLFGSMSVWAQPFGIMSQQPQQKPQHNVLSSESGRFVFGQISASSKDKFMLDTLTGRLWRIAESGKIGIFLMTVSYRTAEGEYSPFPINIPGSKGKEAE
ncbi:MAG: hypothetical protein JRJ06_02105 [Deltaproteobacteria bacterium]|nr:hypothetical protein [Deltaproteobacteria bacterium]MBW1912220.1 hypothetical protein [Deltaproteobacteria bacterium]